MKTKWVVLFSLFCVALHSAALADCLPSPTGLIGWWQGEGNAYDAALANNGVAHGELAFTNGVAGQAFAFNGSDAEVAIGQFNLEQFSVCLWVKPAGSQQAWANIIDDYGTGSASWNIQYNNTGLQFHFGTPPGRRR